VVISLVINDRSRRPLVDARRARSVGCLAPVDRTGHRIHEALGLRWQDVDLDSATIRLRWQFTKDSKEPCAGQTDAGARDLPIL